MMIDHGIFLSQNIIRRQTDNRLQSGRMKNSVIAGALMILPLAIVAVISYWPSARPSTPITDVVVLPPAVQGSDNITTLADEIANTISRGLQERGVRVNIEHSHQDYSDSPERMAIL